MLTHKTFQQISKLIGSSVKDDQINIEEVPKNKLTSSQYIKQQAAGKKKVILLTVE